MNRKLIGLAAAASVVLLVLWYLFVFSKQSNSLHRANVAVSAANSQASSLRSQIQLLQQEKAQLPSATSKLSTLDLALPNTPTLDKLIDDIYADASQAGVDWKAISPTKPALYVANSTQAAAGSALPGGMQAVTVDLGVSGSYQQVMNFVSHLDTLSRLLDVDSVNLTGVGGSGPITAQLATQIFYVPAAGGATTATTVAP
ncbi:MAG TPA: type 4a pilus biogenesis protein PilO [Acidimicrobiales bacterium]|nr:type 4a pilus biogenesis protein PilO [Acidimicrobiales bacterium]